MNQQSKLEMAANEFVNHVLGDCNQCSRDKSNFMCGAKWQESQLMPLLNEAIEALKLECGEKCNAEFNPCNSKETLQSIETKLKERNK